MKKVLLIAGLLVFTATQANAQNYNAYNAYSNYSGYSSQNKVYNYGSNSKNKNAKKYFTFGLDYVASKTSMGKESFTLKSPLSGGADYIGNNEQFEDKMDALSGSFGFRPFKYFGLEAYYEQSLSDNRVLHQEHYAAYPLFAQSEYSVKYKAYGIDALIYIPVATKLELIASAGVAHYEFEGTAYFQAYRNDSGSQEWGRTAPYKVSENKTIFRYGAGVQFILTKRLDFRIMYHYSQIGGDFVDGLHDLTMGVRYKF